MKKMTTTLMIVSVLTCLWGQVEAQDSEETAGIIFGSGYAFAIGAPSGWILDSQSALAIGSRAAIYPKGADLNTTEVWILANALPLGELSVKQWLDQDIDGLKADFPGIKVSTYPDMMTADSLLARIRGFEPAESTYQLYERIAYIKLGNNVAIISLSAYSQDVLEKSIDEFEYVVSGFQDFKTFMDQDPGELIQD